MANLAVHFEIHATEPQRLIDYYSQLFGWQFTKVEGMDYWTIETGDGSVQMDKPGFGINGGLTRREGPAPEPGAAVQGYTMVMGVDDVDAIFASALELGGTETMPLEDHAGIGRFGYVADPDGNVFGVIAPDMGDAAA